MQIKSITNKTLLFVFQLSGSRSLCQQLSGGGEMISQECAISFGCSYIFYFLRSAEKLKAGSDPRRVKTRGCESHSVLPANHFSYEPSVNTGHNLRRAFKFSSRYIYERTFSS
jgi:hypothetical protein